MFSGSLIAPTARGNNGPAVVDMFSIDTARMSDTMGYPQRRHHMCTLCLLGLESTCRFSVQLRLLKVQFWVFNYPRRSLSNIPFKAPLMVLWLRKSLLWTTWSCFFYFFLIRILFFCFGSAVFHTFFVCMLFHSSCCNHKLISVYLYGFIGSGHHVLEAVIKLHGHC